jgi:type III pantothenate kinase
VADLVIDIGNTSLKASWCDGMTLGKTFRYQGERIFDYILSLIEDNRPEKLVLSSVRYLSSQNIERLSGKCDRLIIVDEDIMKRYDIPLHITPDRAASIIASKFLFKGKSCTIFDLGTVLSVDFIDNDGKYAGGNMSLGYRTRFKALNRYSRTVPLLDSSEEVPQYGYDVESSVISGVVSGMMFEIDGYVSSHPENISVFTGGDAFYFAKRMKNSIFVVCNLVLMGLALIAVEYDKKD